MTEFELDVPADQVVRWLKDELAAGGRRVRIRAMREFATEAVANSADFGVDADAEVASMMTIGVLEAGPAGTENGWLLQVRVEDVVGPHTPEEESVPDGAEEIDLDDFEAEFIAPDQGTAYVTVTVETAEAQRRFDQVFGDLIRDRHSGTL